jgi:Ring finger domain
MELKKICKSALEEYYKVFSTQVTVFIFILALFIAVHVFPDQAPTTIVVWIIFFIGLVISRLYIVMVSSETVFPHFNALVSFLSIYAHTNVYIQDSKTFAGVKRHPNNTQVLDCCICLDFIEIGENVIEIHCGHFFHEGCLEKWVEIKPQCPVCKRRLANK